MNPLNPIRQCSERLPSLIGHPLRCPACNHADFTTETLRDLHFLQVHMIKISGTTREGRVATNVRMAEDARVAENARTTEMCRAGVEYLDEGNFDGVLGAGKHVVDGERFCTSPLPIEKEDDGGNRAVDQLQKQSGEEYGVDGRLKETPFLAQNPDQLHRDQPKRQDERRPQDERRQKDERRQQTEFRQQEPRNDAVLTSAQQERNSSLASSMESESCPTELFAQLCELERRQVELENQPLLGPPFFFTGRRAGYGQRTNKRQCSKLCCNVM